MTLLYTVVLLGLNLAVNCQIEEEAGNLESQHREQSENNE
jgi:hypothetical protein